MMKEFEQKEYKVFDMFSHQMALVTAGNMERFNGCTIGWGALAISGPERAVWGRSSRCMCTLPVTPASF